MKESKSNKANMISKLIDNCIDPWYIALLLISYKSLFSPGKLWFVRNPIDGD